MPNQKLYISKITLPGGNTPYWIKDAEARSLINDIKNSVTSVMNFRGKTTTTLTDGSTTNPVQINNESYTASAGDIVLTDQTNQSGKTIEYIFDGTKWQEFGSNTSPYGALAYKDNASTSYTPAGGVSQPTFTGTAGEVSVSIAADTQTGPVTAVANHDDIAINAITSTGTYTPEADSVTTVTNETENKSTTVSAAASGETTYTPAGNVTTATTDTVAVTISGTEGTAADNTLDLDPTVTKGTVNSTLSRDTGTSSDYTVKEVSSINAPTISVATAGATQTYNVVDTVKTSMVETATISYASGTAVAKVEAVDGSDEDFNLVIGNLSTTSAAPITTTSATVKTGDAAYEASAPTANYDYTKLTAASTSQFASDVSLMRYLKLTANSVTVPSTFSFSGTGVRLVTGNIAVPKTYTTSFTGKSKTVSVANNATVSISAHSVTRGAVTATGTFTPAGTVSQPTFTGTAATITVQ